MTPITTGLGKKGLPKRLGSRPLPESLPRQPWSQR